jgi:hypothetical protein
VQGQEALLNNKKRRLLLNKEEEGNQMINPAAITKVA